MVRSEDRRDPPRRGTAEVPRRGQAAQSRLADARRYTPRGRTVREAAAARRADPFRPALQVVAGGRADPPKRAAPAAKAAAKAAKAPARKAPAKKATPRKAAAPRRKATYRAGPPRPGKPQQRLRIATALALAMFALIAGRLVLLQVTDANAYAAKGLTDRLTREVIAAPRGKILDRDGAILAHSVEARYIYADPNLVQDVEGTADKLAPLLGRYGIARSEIVPMLQRHKRGDGTDVRFVYLARGVDIADGDAVRAMNLAGVRVRRDERREVPGHDLAATVLGFTGRDRTGLEGLELAYNQQLRGVDGEKVYEIGRGRLDREIPGGVHRQRPARPGVSVQLTVDRYVQFEVQQILAARLREVKALVGAAVVLDVQTGEVVAQASFPGYDAADPLAAGDAKQRVDGAAGLVVDPGSTHKALVLGAGLQEGVIKPDSTVMVGPPIMKGDRPVVDTHPHPKETPITLAGVLAYSSNIGTVRVADLLGAERLYRYQRLFGLGETTGEGLPGEAAGQVRAPKDWSGTSYGTIPIGNGVAVTPLQMAAAYAAIANGGKWVQPHLVLRTVAPDGTATPVPAPKTRQVLDPANARALAELLEAPVVAKGGTATKAAIPGYRVAGKTGTGARVVDGKYTDGYVASFIGMAPADAPRFVVAVFAHAPDAHGADMAPAFRDMMRFTLDRFKVPPTGAEPPPVKIYP